MAAGADGLCGCIALCLELEDIEAHGVLPPHAVHAAIAGPARADASPHLTASAKPQPEEEVTHKIPKANDWHGAQALQQSLNQACLMLQDRSADPLHVRAFAAIRRVGRILLASLAEVAWVPS